MFLVMAEYDYNLQSRSREMHEGDSMNEQWLLGILLQILNAVAHLVSSNVLHRDMKLDNVLIKREGNVERLVVHEYSSEYLVLPIFPLFRPSRRVYRNFCVV